jgi:multidrug efflux pump subunit AcrA (membrane-fusion protein)
MDEDSQWLRLREREELRDARKKIKSQEISIAALRTENRKLRKALDEADLLAGLDGLELELEEDVAF